MRGIEQPPITLPNREFPFGDVTDQSHSEMADDWFDTVSAYPEERLRNYMEYASKPKDMHDKAGKATHQAALKLCENWDYHHDGLLNLHITSGYLLARTFQDETRFLPAFTVDLSEQLREMGDNDRTKNGVIIPSRLSKAEFFGRTAWAAMERSHPNVHKQFKRLIEIARVPFSLNLDDGEQYFIVGMMMPYIFSCVSQIENHVSYHGYTGLEAESAGE
jgi:hypothetical protein